MARYNFPVPTILGNIEPPQLPTDALPNIPATTTTLGGVKVDGTTIKIDAEGVISASGGGGAGGNSFWYGNAGDPNPTQGSEGEWFIDFRGGTWSPQYKTSDGWKKATDIDKNFSLIPYIKKTISQEHSNFVLTSLADVVEDVAGSADAYNLFMSQGTPNIKVYGDQQKIEISFPLKGGETPNDYVNVGRPIGGKSRQLDDTTKFWSANITASYSVGVLTRRWFIEAVLADSASCDAFLNCASLVPDDNVKYHGVVQFVDVFNDKQIYVRDLLPNASLRRDAEDKKWELSYNSASLSTITSENRLYTVKKTDTDAIFWATANATAGNNVCLFLDSKQNYKTGATIQIRTSGDLSIQVVPLGDVGLLDTGSPQPGGRKIGTSRRDSQGNLVYVDTSASLLYLGNNQWVLRGASLELGAPWIESAGRADPTKWNPGTCRVFTNGIGEDTTILTGLKMVAKNIRPGSTEVTKDVTKLTRYYDWTDLTGGETYEFSARYNIFKDGKQTQIQSWNTVRYRIDKNEPYAPTNIAVVGGRGPRLFYKFSYDDSTGAPWDGIQAQAYGVDGSVITNWISMDPLKDPVTGNYWLTFAPGYIPTGKGKIKLRLTRSNNTVIGDTSAFCDVDWDAYRVQAQITDVTIPKGTTNAFITWKQLSTVDTPDCSIEVSITDTAAGRVVLSQSNAWNDTDLVFNGSANKDYSVTITPKTYGALGIADTRAFRIPSPF